ncbi:MAG: DUF697 domain-containing protein [bacterium]|nr:DUF697 domain-containing protein [bacterium]
MTEKKKVVEEKKEVTEEVTEDAQELGANKIVKKYVLWATGAGLIPFPFFDLGAVSAAQLKMLHSMGKHYGVEFKENRVKSIVATLIGTLGAHSLRQGAITNFIKSIPIIGFVGSYSFALYSGALTYAIGKVFIQHFESGGTFLDFDPKKVKEHFKKLFEDGKNAVAKLKPKKSEAKVEAEAKA